MASGSVFSVTLFGESLRLHSDVALNEAGKLWPVTERLARWIATEPWTSGGGSADRPRIIELGAGTGALGIALARAVRGIDVVVTDLPAVLPLLVANVEAGGPAAEGSHVTAAAYSWGDALGALAPATHVLLCECMYWGGWSLLSSDTRDLLEATMCAFAAEAPVVIYVGFTVRDEGRELGFVRRLASLFTIEYEVESATLDDALLGSVLVFKLLGGPRPL